MAEPQWVVEGESKKAPSQSATGVPAGWVIDEGHGAERHVPERVASPFPSFRSTAAHPVPEGQEPQSSPLMEQLGQAAHPQTAADFLGLVLPTGIPPLAKIAGKVPVRAVVHAGAQAAQKGAAAAANLAEHPAISSVLGAGLGYAHSGLPGAIEGAVLGPQAGRLMRVLRKFQGSASTKAPALAEIVEEVRKTPEAEAGSAVAGESVQARLNREAITARRARNAAAQTTSQQILAEQPDLVHKFARTVTPDEAGPIWRATDFTKLTKVKVPVSKIVATQDGFQNPKIEQYRLHPGSELPSAMKVGDEYFLADGHHHALAKMANGATEIELNVHPVDPALRANPQPRALWLDSGGKLVGGGHSIGHVPLTEAMSAVREARKAAGVNLTATQFDQATKLAQRGVPVEKIMDAVHVQEALKTSSSSLKGLPTDAEMQATVAKRLATSKARSTNPRYGSHQGNYGRRGTDVADVEPVSGNPFR